jgi:HTH-type transcriptional regulator / antitoxin HigA
MNAERTQQAWAQFQGNAQIKRPQSESDYLELHSLMDALTSKHRMDDPVWSPLIDLIGRYMLEWENANDPWAQVEAVPRDVLANLMRDRNINQVDLETAGVVAQSTLSQILNGKRSISKGVAKKLSAFFGVPVGAFL